MATVLGIVTAAWALVMALAPALQIRRILARRSSGDVSVGYLCILVVGFALWVGYGAAIGNLVLVLPNGVALVTGIVTLAVAVRFRDPPSRTPSAGGEERLRYDGST
jgi:uncharacterized protein with PQ loop repeat